MQGSLAVCCDDVLVAELGADKLAVEASDVGDRLVLGAYSLLTSSLTKYVFYNWLINNILYLCVT